MIEKQFEILNKISNWRKFKIQKIKMIEFEFEMSINARRCWAICFERYQFVCLAHGLVQPANDGSS